MNRIGESRVIGMRGTVQRYRHHGQYTRRAKRWNPLRLLLVCFFSLIFMVSGFLLIRRGVQALRVRRINRENQALIADAFLESDEETEPYAGKLNGAGRKDALTNEAGNGDEYGSGMEPGNMETLDQANETEGPAECEIEPLPTILPDAERLLERNPDFIGWLKVEAIDDINFAVVQRDNEYYLTHDFNGSVNSYGAAFLDEDCHLLPRDENLIIYAHRMYDGAMFGNLHHMVTLDRIREHPFVKFFSLYEKDTYVPVAVLYCSVVPAKEDFFLFNVSDFALEGDFGAYIARARELSAIHSPYDAIYGDKLLTLSTCVKDDPDKRLVVILRAIREDESEEELLALLDR